MWSQLGGVERLHRVDHAHIRPLALEHRADRVELGLGHDLDAVAAAEPFRAELHLRDGLLTGDEQRAPRLRDRAERGEQQRRLADAGLAADEDERCGHETSAEHPVELVDPGRDPGGLLGGDVNEAKQRPCLGRLGAAGRSGFLQERPERPATGAASEPPPGDGAALGTRELNGRCFRHQATVRASSDGICVDFATIAPQLPSRRRGSGGRLHQIDLASTRMARTKLRSRKDVVERSLALSGELRQAFAQLSLGQLSWNDGGDHPTGGVWAGEGLGMLLWALEVAQLPPYDRPFDGERLVATPLDDVVLRPPEEIERARDTARLWHWRARTAVLAAAGDVDLPQDWQSFDQLVGATAMRGFERGLLPRPLRGDFPAFGVVYRELTAEQQDEAHQIAWQRHRALNWLCGLGKSGTPCLRTPEPAVSRPRRT